jgi:hypothetical protein
MYNLDPYYDYVMENPKTKLMRPIKYLTTQTSKEELDLFYLNSCPYRASVSYFRDYDIIFTVTEPIDNIQLLYCILEPDKKQIINCVGTDLTFKHIRYYWQRAYPV